MEFKEGVYKSVPHGTLFEPEPDPKPEQHQFRRWLLALGVLLLLALLAGGLFAYTHLSQNVPTVGAPPPIHWCISTGAPLAAQAGLPSLRHVVTLSPENIWVVGNTTKFNSHDNSELGVPLVEHWNGTHWSIVTTADTTPLFSDLLGKFPGSANQIASLNSFVAITPNDMWAIGEVRVTQSLNGSSGFGHTLIEHWNGHQWQIIASPDVSPQGINSLANMVAISATNIWAVGTVAVSSLQADDAASFSPLVEHWDGSSWSLMQLPASLHGTFLSSVTATSADDVWAVGAARANLTVGSTSDNAPLAAHWDGHSWSAVTLPPSLSLGSFFAVTAISAQDVWAAGASSFGSQSSPILAHWDGRQWRKVRDSNGVAIGSTFLASVADVTNDVWVVGDLAIHIPQTPTIFDKPLIEHWNGQSWSNVAFPNIPYGSLSDVAIVGGKVWVIGNKTDATGQVLSPLIETQC